MRESQGTVGQYVLTGMQNNTKKHLLLVDPEGVVSTIHGRNQTKLFLVLFHSGGSTSVGEPFISLLLSKM